MASPEQEVTIAKKYFLLGVFIYEHEVWAISCLTGTEFKFLKQEQGPIRVFKDDEEAKEFANKNSIQLEPGIELLELEPIIEWVRYEKTPVDCKAFINAYNCTEDFSELSVHSLATPDEFGLSILRKLYRGSMDPEQLDDEEPFNSEWSEFEIMYIKKLMSEVIVFWMEQLKDKFIPEFYLED